MSVCMYPVTNKGSLCATIRTNMLRANPITLAHAHAGTGSEISLRRERRWVRGSPKVQVIQSSVGRLIACRITSAAVNEAASFGNAVEIDGRVDLLLGRCGSSISSHDPVATRRPVYKSHPIRSALLRSHRPHQARGQGFNSIGY